MRFIIQALPFLLLSATSAFANIYDHDGRTFITSHKSPWAAVGLLTKPDRTYCSASMVGPDLLLTNAHCVLKNSGDFIRGDYTFKPMFHKGPVKWRGRYLVAKILKFYVGSRHPHMDHGNDWALLRTNWKIGDQIGYFGVAVYEPEQLSKLTLKVYMASYDDDRFGTMMYQTCAFHTVCSADTNCLFINRDMPPIVRHDCSLSTGASGAPIFLFPNQDPALTKLVAIQATEVGDRAGQTLKGIPYSDTYANMAIPAKNFYWKIKEILGLQTVKTE
jgi:protease YdgD